MTGGGKSGERVLVTGGAGFIGSHIVEALLTQGHEIVVLDNLSSGARRNVPPSVRIIEADIRSSEAAEFVATYKPTVLVHAAAQISVRISMEDPVLDSSINVVGFVNLLQACPRDSLPFVVFTSTGGAIYGEQDYFPADEAHPIRPTSLYGLSKRVGEEYLEFWAREFGLQRAVLRLANVYGPRQNPHGEAGVVAIFCKKILAGQAPLINGAGTQTRDFVYVGDVANAVLAAITLKSCGTYNVGTGQETSVIKLTDGIIKALGSKDIVAEYGPAKPGEQQRSCITPANALKSLNFAPKMTLAEGLRVTAHWFATEGSNSP